MAKTKNIFAELGGLILVLCLWLFLLQPYGVLRQFGATDYTKFLSVDFLDVTVLLALAVFGFVLGVSLWTKNPNAVLLAKIYFILSFVHQAAWVTYFVYGNGLQGVLANFAPEDVLKMIVCPPLTLAWFFYFSMSARVREIYSGVSSDVLSEVNPAGPSPDKLSASLDVSSDMQDDFNDGILNVERKASGDSTETASSGGTAQTYQSSGTSSNTGTGRIIEVKEKYNIGIVLRIIGILFLFAFPIGTLVGVGLIIAGWKMAKKYSCSECGNLLSSKQVKLCPTCRATLSPFESQKQPAP